MDLKEELNSHDIIIQHHAIIGLRKIMSQENLPINQFLQADLVPKIVEYANKDYYPHLQL
jgi:hypothetical protein